MMRNFQFLDQELRDILKGYAPGRNVKFPGEGRRMVLQHTAMDVWIWRFTRAAPIPVRGDQLLPRRLDFVCVLLR